MRTCSRTTNSSPHSLIAQPKDIWTKKTPGKRTAYSGAGLVSAKALTYAAQGGMCLLSESCALSLSSRRAVDAKQAMVRVEGTLLRSWAGCL